MGEVFQTDRAKFLAMFLDLPAAAQDDEAQWEGFQIAHLNDDSVFRIEDKSRQIAWSFTVAAEAVADAMLHDAVPTSEGTIFVSINLEEAREKIRYAKRVYEHLARHAAYPLPRLVADNVLGLEFDNGARLLSLPSTPPRGKAKMHVVLDEFAHVQRDREIYTAALPIVSRGGRLRIGSSPMGAVGTFWEISRQELQAYPGFTRVITPWWQVRMFCQDRALPAAADTLDTLDRVERYGNDRLRLLCESMILEDFQQEFECDYVDEVTSYFPWAMIKKNQDENLKCWHVKDIDDIQAVALDIKRAIAAGEVEPVLVGGVDVGRRRNLTEIILLGVGQSCYPIRLMVSLDKVKFDDQEQCLRHLLGVLPVALLYIDENGIGMHLAENLGRDTSTEPATFTNANKGLWAVETRIRLDRGEVPLPVDRDLAYQIHSVKRKVTAAKNNVYDTARNEKHHADKFWALALALWAAREFQNVSTVDPKQLQWERR